MNQKTLETLITKANEKYRKGEPIMSDKEYDEVLETLAYKYPDSELVKKAVIEEPEESRKQPLPVPMFSLNKVKTFEELTKWIKSIDLSKEDELVLTPKYDGISLCVNEAIGKCWTRGNGVEGQKSDKHYSLIDSRINWDIPMGYTFGEAIMKKDTFNEKYKGDYKSARNYVAGIFNRKQAIPATKDVDYIRYGRVDSTTGSKYAHILSLNEINKVKVPLLLIKVKDLTEEVIESFFEGNNQIYQIDGVVIDVNDGKKRKELGREENNNPRYARAYKNPEWSSKHTSIVKDVIFNVSKQGKLKPVILIEPVDIDGVIVERVTGYNAKYIFDNNIAKASEIELTRSGDVIPKHLKTLTYIDVNVEGLADRAVECPVCGSVTKWDDTLTEIVCTNIYCEGRMISKFEHFFKTIGVEEFARPSIVQLYEAGFDRIDSILNIPKEELSNLDGWGERSAEVLLEQFERVITQGLPLAKVFHAMDIFNGQIGEKTCQLIIDNYDISEGIDSFSIPEIVKIKGVAEKTAWVYKSGIEVFYFGMSQSYCNFNSELLEGFMLPIKISYIQTPKKEVTGDKYKGWKVCFTGVRDKELEEYIKEQGGEVVSGVSGKTTHLIVKDLEKKTLSSSKAKKAKSMEIEIIPIEKLRFPDFE
jgi:NAD-dependent DNA ligase